MKKFIGIISIGVVAGAIGWAVVSLVSDRYEPFDSSAGFFIGQFILSIIAIWVGYKKNFGDLVVYLLGAYLGMNAFSFIFGGSEQRAWALFGLITTIGLVAIPLVIGIIGKMACVAKCKYRKGSSVDDRSSCG